MRRFFYEQIHIINPRFLATILLLVLFSNILMISIFDGVHSLALRHLIHSLLGVALLLIIANSDQKLWFRYAFFIYLGGLALLVAVDVFGVIGLGARRWLDLGFFRFQPSELMKIAIILALARYFQALNPQDFLSFRTYVVPFFIVAAPFVLVALQPDLGTAMLLLILSFGIILVAGLPRRFIYGGAALGVISFIYLWLKVLLPYQKQRIFSFLDPASDPAGSGYHINQSIIAIGSGGFFGKGFGAGSQTQLNFLPEKHTDFIFTVLAEEFGFVGSIIVLLLQYSLIYFGLSYSREIVPQFAKLVAFGVIGIYAVQVSINTSMVLGLLPVVGVPLPIFSYGGTSMITYMVCFGLFFSAMKTRYETQVKY